MDFNKRTYRLATRNSQLAMSQTNEIIQKLIQIEELNLSENNFEIVEVSQSKGDVNLQDPLYNMGGIGVFTKQVELELLQNKADIAVHSLKDMPTVIDKQLFIGAIPNLQLRNDVVLLNEKYQSFDQLLNSQNVIIGTSSLRRLSCLKYHHPNFQFKNIRGNLNTRLQKLKNNEYDAIILANAGVSRLKWDENMHVLDIQKYLYAPGQGALGVQCRIDDNQCKELLKYIDNNESRIRTEAERQFLNKLEGGCKLPIAVYSEIQNDQLWLIGQVWDLEGQITVRSEIKENINDSEIGTKLAIQMVKLGADKILQKIKLN